MLAPCLPTLGAMQHEDQMPLLAAAMAEHNRSGRQHLREATELLRKMKSVVKVEKVERVEIDFPGLLGTFEAKQTNFVRHVLSRGKRSASQ